MGPRTRRTDDRLEASFSIRVYPWPWFSASQGTPSQTALAGFQLPALLVPRKADVWIVSHRLRRGQQHQARLRCAFCLRPADQFAPDSLLLIPQPNGEIREIRGIAKVGDRPGNAHQRRIIPRRDHQVGVGQHPAHTVPVVHRTPFAERRCAVKFDDLIQVELVASLIPNHEGWFYYNPCICTSRASSSFARISRIASWPISPPRCISKWAGRVSAHASSPGRVSRSGLAAAESPTSRRWPERSLSIGS